MKRANNIVVKSMERGNDMKKNVICDGINTTPRTPIEIALSAEDGFTTAKKLYEWLELDPTHYSRWIQSNLIENPFAEEGTDYSPLMASKKGRGQFAKDYRLSVSFAKKLAMATKSEKGELARIYFLMCERALVQSVKANEKLKIERAKGIAVRKSLTDVILASGENERMKGHAFPTYTDLVYKKAIGKTARQIRKERDIGKNETVRDYLDEEEIEAVMKVENAVTSLLDLGWTYPEIKAAIEGKKEAEVA